MILFNIAVAGLVGYFGGFIGVGCFAIGGLLVLLQMAKWEKNNAAR